MNTYLFNINFNVKSLKYFFGKVSPRKAKIWPLLSRIIAFIQIRSKIILIKTFFIGKRCAAKNMHLLIYLMR